MTQVGLLEQRPVPCVAGTQIIKTQKTFPVFSNEDKYIAGEARKVLYEVSSIVEGDVDAIVTHAHQAGAAWRATDVKERREIVERAAKLLSIKAAQISDIISNETVVPKGFAHFQVEHGAKSHLEECAAVVEVALESQKIVDTGEVQKFIYRQPFGVVLGIAPWNAPFVLALRAILWAIAAGNTAILKTSEHAPLTHLSVAQLLNEAGLPPAVLSVVHVDPKDAPAVTEALIAHPFVRKVNFTGSTHVGRILATTAAKYLTPIILELGGKAPVVVLQDADVELAANNIVFGGYLNSNQICMAVNNIIVHESIKGMLIMAIRDIFEKHTKAFKAGQGSDHQIRALFTTASADRLRNLYEDAMAKGASVCAGQVGFDGAVVQPIVLQGINKEMKIFSEETFGPILSILTFTTEDEAIKLANQNSAGLAGAVFSRDIAKAFVIAQQIEAGQVHVNSHSVHDHGRMPHGGWKQSGYGRLGGGVDGIREFTQTQGFTVQTGSKIPIEFL
jgi:acyl-CoA reductase-like NAD-dependent aldehyde dehydrogenase